MIYLQYLGSYMLIPYFILSCKRRSKSFPQCKTLHCYSVLVVLKAEGKSLRETAFLTLEHWAKGWRERNSQRAVNGGTRQNDVKQLCQERCWDTGLPNSNCTLISSTSQEPAETITVQ